MHMPMKSDLYDAAIRRMEKWIIKFEKIYIADFGKADDWCLVAEIKENRHLGIGTALMRTMLQFLKNKGYKQASLSVQKANYAVEMYRKAGFEVVDENEEEYIMVCRL